MKTRLWICFVPFGIAASCGGTIAPYGSDAGSDVAPATCAAASDCPSGFLCEYPVSSGCSAKKTCLPAPGAGACKGEPYCACDGFTSVNVCSAGAPTPVQHPGPCKEGPPCGSGLSCEVCDVTGFSVVPQAKPSQATNACSQEDISSFVTACLDTSATQATCTAWEQSDAGKSGCSACVITQDVSSTWGPLVCDSSGCTINMGGCIDIVSGQVAIENGTNGSCGDLTNATAECIAYACGACPTPSDSETLCSQAAEQAECKSYVDAEQGAATCALDAGTNACSPQSDSDWTAFINLFCGTGP